MPFYKRLSCLVLVLMTLTACASGNKQWVKDDTPRSEVDQALAECKYQAEVATVGIGSHSHPKAWTDAIGDGIGDGIVRAMDENDLIESCMTAKGYER